MMIFFTHMHTRLCCASAFSGATSPCSYVSALIHLFSPGGVCGESAAPSTSSPLSALALDCQLGVCVSPRRRSRSSVWCQQAPGSCHSHWRWQRRRSCDPIGPRRAETRKRWRDVPSVSSRAVAPSCIGATAKVQRRISVYVTAGFHRKKRVEATTSSVRPCVANVTPTAKNRETVHKVAPLPVLVRLITIPSSLLPVVAAPLRD